MKKIILFGIISVLFPWNLCAQADGDAARESVAFVERWADYCRQVKLEVKADKACLNEETFNVQDYMALFPALAVEPGREIRCLYYSDGMNGGPLLYAAETGKAYEKALKRYRFEPVKMSRKDKEKLKDLHKSGGATDEEAKELMRRIRKAKPAFPAGLAGKSPREIALIRYASDSLNKAFCHVVPEDSGIGYFQYLILSEFGEKFGLYGHWDYGYGEPVCTRARMKELAEQNQGESYLHGTKYDEAQMEAALDEDFTPRIELQADKCTITLCVFRASFGLHECTYEISRQAPYAIALVHEREIVGDGVRYIYY